jgi:branched-chain amino acid transport system substrate-binding protein
VAESTEQPDQPQPDPSQPQAEQAPPEPEQPQPVQAPSAPPARAQSRVTRRDLIRTSSAIGVAGLVVGGGIGYLAASRGVGTQSLNGGTTGGNQQPLRVVAVLPLTGPTANDGLHAANGTQLAINEINGLGGVLGHPLQYVPVDLGAIEDPQGVRNAFSRAATQENPDVIVGAGIAAMGPDLDEAAAAGVIYLEGDTREDWRTLYMATPDKYWSVFQTDPAETAYGRGFALFLDQLVQTGKYKPPAKTVALIAGDDPYDTHITQVFQDGISKLGWTVTFQGTVTPQQVVDWGPILSQIRQNPPAVVFTTDYSSAEDAAMAKNFAASPIPSLLYQQYGPSAPEWLDLAGSAGNGVIWSTVLGLQVDPIGNAFRQKYRAAYNLEPSWAYAGALYDNVWLWAEAAMKSNDPKNVRKVAELIQDGTHRGVTGGMSFGRYDANGNFVQDHTVPSYPSETQDPSVGQPHIIVQVQNGTHRVIYPAPFTDSDFQLPPWVSQAG